jgi:hypothetical protein
VVPWIRPSTIPHQDERCSSSSAIEAKALLARAFFFTKPTPLSVLPLVRAR